MTDQEKDALFEQNVQVINQMDVAAGSMIKHVVHDLDRRGRNTYIALHDPAPDGHSVDYDFLEGDETLIGRIGRSLGLAVTASRLEVPGA